jgi:hypothetical protein
MFRKMMFVAVAVGALLTAALALDTAGAEPQSLRPPRKRMPTPPPVRVLPLDRALPPVRVLPPVNPGGQPGQLGGIGGYGQGRFGGNASGYRSVGPDAGPRDQTWLLFFWKVQLFDRSNGELTFLNVFFSENGVVSYNEVGHRGVIIEGTYTFDGDHLEMHFGNNNNADFKLVYNSDRNGQVNHFESEPGWLQEKVIVGDRVVSAPRRRGR